MSKKPSRTFLAGMQEKKTGFEELFWEMDKDRSGYLSMRELAKLLMKSGYTLSKSELEAKFAGMDKNNDGQVSYDEYLKVMGAVEPVTHRQAFYRRKFKRYDENGDGSVSREELENVLDDLDLSSNPDYVQEVFRQCDRDGTGRIEYEEFINHFCTGN